MAKKNKISPFLLFTSAVILLTAGWLMPSFPILIFVALAPLFALTDRTDAHSPLWEKMEYILLALGISSLAFFITQERSVILSLVSSIALTIAFVAHAWVVRTLGMQSGKISIILFWLSIEYLFLKVSPGASSFIADTLRLHPAWIRWTIHTGYLGVTLWVLLINWMIYHSFLTSAGIRWIWLFAAMVLLIAPILYSYQLQNSPISHEEMVNLYLSLPIQADVNYLARGEFIVRTAAWLSTLILLFTFVRSQTTRR